jgi:tetratricopeptide (TPR) repeat protein
MIVFQIAFGLAVFAITREVYMQDAQVARVTPKLMSKPWQGMGDAGGANNQFEVVPLVPEQLMSDDPLEIARQADEYFGAKQYAMAAQLYQKLLGLGGGDVNTYNSLGLTLQYLGRSGEALQVLNEGIALEPGFQRIWLTTGFVNMQVGDLVQARAALNKAIELGPDNDVGQSAAKMLAGLPPG